MTRFAILAGTAVLALAASAQAQVAPTTAPLATAANADSDTTEIIVTAQKRAERLQDVPLAVSVVSGDTLATQGRVSLEGAQYLVPSLNFLKAGTTLNQSLFLRGVGTATFSIAGEPSVSTVLDGVVFSRAGEAFSDLVDIERIEVLRGPQGTLFGKNSSAGVINIVSKRPGDKLGGYAEGGTYTGNGAEYRVRGALDVPLSAQVRSRLTGFYDKYDGNIFNVAPNVNRRVNGFEHYGARAIVEGDASETVKLTLIGDYHKNNDDCCAEVIGGPPQPATTPANIANLALIQTVLPPLQGNRTRQVDQNLVTHTNEIGWGVSLQADLELGTQTVTSITAYRNYRNTEIRDGDFLPQAYIGFNQLHDNGPQTGDTVSQELRLTSPSKQFLTYVLGAYYSRAKSERIFTRSDQLCRLAPGAVAPAGVLTPCSSALAAPSTFPTGTADFGSVFTNVALFGQGTLNLASRFRLIGGLRFTIDQLDVFHSRVTVPNTVGLPGIGGNFDSGVNAEYNRLVGLGVPANLAVNQAIVATNGIPFRARATSNNLSGKAGAQFDVTGNSVAYATYSRGYKGPAFNVFFNLNATGTNSISPETSDAYEIGLKNTLFGGKLTLNLAAYLAKYKNFQANNPDLVNGVVTTRFTNAGSVSTRGGELDLLLRPVKDLSISGGLAYTDAHVDQFKIPQGNNTGVIQSGTPLGFAPKWKGDIGIDYRIVTSLPVDFGLGAQGSYQSSELSLFVADSVQRAAGTIGAYGLVNLTASVMDHDDKYKLTFVVRNLLDQSFAAAISNGGTGGAYRYQIPRDADRYYGVTARLNF